ncbi:RnfH family protein [Limnohabitans sp. Rim8]|uniref:RnfH family protein n=1 Tax=Limnohabitans sp. Rim8 TaxID=1100718 RepID=UPI0025EA0B60|nr:RnfH family protein [Limnohabitans sp. Rim8]
MAETGLHITLCWSLEPRHVHEMSLQVTKGSTLQDVLEQGVALCLHAKGSSDSASLSSLQCQQPGIWGKKVPWTQVVQAGDRIELYRPLKVDPKVARRQRFKRQGKGRTGLFANRKSGSAAGY